MQVMQRWAWLAGLICGAFALRALLLIDATALWSDELYSVGKSFQASPAAVLGMLRQDTHPPLYYLLLWGWGQLVGQSPISLRLLSWLAYLAETVIFKFQRLEFTSIIDIQFVVYATRIES